MLNKNSQFKNNGYQVWGYKASHHKDAICVECKNFTEVATLWKRDDFDHSDICANCAEKYGYEVVNEKSIALRAKFTNPIPRKTFNYRLNRWK